MLILLGVRADLLTVFLCGANFVAIMMGITTSLANKRSWSPAPMPTRQKVSWWAASIAAVGVAAIGLLAFAGEDSLGWSHPLTLSCGVPCVFFLWDGIHEAKRLGLWPFLDRSTDQLSLAFTLMQEDQLHAAGVAAGTAVEMRLRDICKRLGCLPRASSKFFPSMRHYQEALCRKDPEVFTKEWDAHVAALRGVRNRCAHGADDIARAEVSQALTDIQVILAKYRAR